MGFIPDGSQGGPPFPTRFEAFILKCYDLQPKIAKHPWYTAAGILTGAILISPLWHRLSIRECKCDGDLTAKTVIITGGEQGVGKATAMELAKRNAEIIIGSKNGALAAQVVKEIKAATGNKNVSYKLLDLRSFKSVKDFAEEVEKTKHQVNILINAADDFYPGEKSITEDGCERMMQSNYLGHFLLTTSLTGCLKESTPSKVINVTSVGHQFTSLDLEDLSCSYYYSPLSAYLKSKLACMLWTTELSTKLQGKGVTVNVVNPGLVKNTSGQGFIMRMMYLFYGKTPAQGAQTILQVALSPETTEVSGKYFRNCKERFVLRTTKDKTLATRLFKLSEDLVGYKM